VCVSIHALMGIRTGVMGAFVSLDIEGDFELSDLDPMFAALEGARAKGPFVVITDTTFMNTASRPVIAAFAARLRRSMPDAKQVWLADAVVTQSPAVRFLLSTLVMIAPMPARVKTFSDRADAEHWCVAVLREQGLSVPAALGVPVERSAHRT
jgi:hypothetical protein